MKKCIFCKKVIWFWQHQYLGSDTAHKSCDYMKFCAELDNLVEKGYLTEDDASLQKALRLTNADY